MKKLMQILNTVLLTFFVKVAFAEETPPGIAKLANNVTGQLPAIAKLITAGSYLTGIGFALFGLLKLKAHKDAPTQVPLSTGIVYLFIGAGLAFLPSLLATMGMTIFGENATPTGVQGVADIVNFK